MADIPLAEQVTELKRELHMRHRVYPKWVASGRMEQREADRHVARLEAAIETLSRLAEEQDRAGRLL